MLESRRDVLDHDLARKADAYLREAFGLASTLEPYRVEGLPFFIEDQYALWWTDLFGRACLIMAVRGGEGAPIDELERHVALVRSRAEIPLVALLFPSLNHSKRRGLVVRRLAFLVPGAQLFVPEAILDLRERTSRPPVEEVETFSPTAQLLILGALLQMQEEGESATALARRFGVANMSVTRALDELEAAGVGRTNREGRERRLQFTAHGRALWDLAEKRLRSPVRKVRTVIMPSPRDFPGREAGESALSRHTSLAPPRRRRLAVASADWNQLVRDHGLRETEHGDPGGDEIETWSYDPGALARLQGVDPLSLHLSLRDDPDERVAGAADELLESFVWS